jgi:hypothetical protein
MNGGVQMTLKENTASQKVFKDMGMHKWREAKIMDLKKGARIRLYSIYGRPLELGGDETFLTESDAFQIAGTWAIKVRAA